MSDPGLHTPLLDFFRRGEAAREARLLAAQGALATRALEQLALLILLHDDGDGEVAAAARKTLAALPVDQLSAFLGRSDVPGEMRDFFVSRGIKPGPPIPGDEPDVMVDAGELPHVPESDDKETTTVITALPVMDRLKLATKGTREQRAVLIRDPNKLIAVAVLSSPKLADSEVEAFARMGNVSDEVLRIIGNNRSWTKNYGVVAALVRNPKTPPAISLNLMARLNDRDMKMLAMDRNVPEGLRLAARKYLVKSQHR
jgi:hypothetical protein